MLPLVKDLVLELKKRIELGRERYSGIHPSQIANALNVRAPGVCWCLHMLNLEGIVSQPHRGRHEDVYYVIAESPPTRRHEPIVHAPDSPEWTLAIWDEKEPEKLPRFSKRLQRRIWKDA